MGERTCSGGGSPKRVKIDDLDRWIKSYAHPPEDPEIPQDIAPDEVEVYGSLSLSIALFTAWRDHGVMPRSGGYEDQPRRWRAMIALFNQRYYRAYHEEASYDVDPNSFTVETDTPARGFDAFRQG